MTRSASRAEIVRELSERLRALERSDRLSVGSREVVGIGIEPLEGILPARGFQQGTIVEWLLEGEGNGAGALILRIVAKILSSGGAFVVVDDRHEFYPPAALGVGIDPEKMVIVRPGCARDALWAFEQSLRCAGVAIALCRIERLANQAYRRLQLAVEAGGGIGMVMRPAKARREPSWAMLRMLVRARPPATAAAESSVRRLQVELIGCRGGKCGAVTELEICDETDLVRLASPLAPPATANRAAEA